MILIRARVTGSFASVTMVASFAPADCRVHQLGRPAKVVTESDVVQLNGSGGRTASASADEGGADQGRGQGGDLVRLDQVGQVVRVGGKAVPPGRIEGPLVEERA